MPRPMHLSAPWLASAANDGTVKLWSSSEDGFKSWTCVSCLQYRESPCLSLAFSTDGSLMALGHGNLLSLWDPSSLTVVSQLVSPTSNDIIWVSFLELSATGAAYLFYATRRSLTLMNLLTMETVWRVLGRFSHFAASSDGKPLFLNAKAYLCCVEEVCGTSDSENVTDDENFDADSVHEDEVQPSKVSTGAISTYRVCYFDILSSKPVLIHVLSSKPLSLSILRGTHNSICRVLLSLQNGAIALLEDAKYAREVENDLESQLEISAKIRDITQSREVFTSLDSDAAPLTYGTSEMHTDLSAVISLDSESLPSVSTLFENYMRRLMSNTDMQGDVIVDASKIDEHSTLSQNKKTATNQPKIIQGSLGYANMSISSLACAGEAMYSHLLQEPTSSIQAPVPSASEKPGRRKRGASDDIQPVVPTSSAPEADQDVQPKNSKLQKQQEKVKEAVLGSGINLKVKGGIKKQLSDPEEKSTVTSSAEEPAVPPRRSDRKK